MRPLSRPGGKTYRLQTVHRSGGGHFLRARLPLKSREGLRTCHIRTNLIALERLPKVLDGSRKDCSAICNQSPWVTVQLVTVPSPSAINDWLLSDWKLFA